MLAAGFGAIAGIAGAGTATVLDNHVAAYIDNSAQVNLADAGSAASQLVNLLAWDDTVVDAVSVAIGAAAAPVLGLSATATFDFAFVAKDTEAYIGSGAIVESNSNVELRSISDEDMRVIAGSLAAGSLVAGAAFGSLHTVQARSQAYTSGGATVSASDDVLVLAESTSEDDVIGIVGSAGGLLNGQVMFTDADLGGATSNGLSIAGMTVGGVPGITSASVDGTVIANDLDVKATANITPNAVAILGGVGGINVNVAQPVATTSHETSISFGALADVQINAPLDPMAQSTNDASAFAFGIGAGAISASAVLPEAEAGGATRAFVGEGAEIEASSLDLRAEAINLASTPSIQLSAGRNCGKRHRLHREDDTRHRSLHWSC